MSATDWLARTQEVTAEAEARGYDTVEIEIGALARLVEIAVRGEAVVARWDTPLWKDAEPTGHIINRLRASLAGDLG